MATAQIQRHGVDLANGEEEGTETEDDDGTDGFNELSGGGGAEAAMPLLINWNHLKKFWFIVMFSHVYAHHCVVGWTENEQKEEEEEGGGGGDGTVPLCAFRRTQTGFLRAVVHT